MKTFMLRSVWAAAVLAWPGIMAGVRAADPDFGPNVVIFDPASTNIQSKLDEIQKQQLAAQFGAGRYAVMFKPGKYDANVMVGFYVHTMGLGKSPDDVLINGYLGATASWMKYNATCNFWRTVENLAVQSKKTVCWSVSQGTAFRRVHVMGPFSLAEGGWSSGGFVGDCKVDGKIGSNSQQQYLTRNTEMSGWSSGVWNMVFVGDTGAPTSTWPRNSYTVVEKTPVIREKPFLCFNDGKWSIMVPPLEKNVSGTSWATRKVELTSIPIEKCYIAKESDTAATINAALAAGKHLILTPGHYKLDDAIKVTKPDTVVLGLGYPTLEATKGNIEMQVADVDGVKIAGVLFEAREPESPVLLEIGPKGSSADHSKNPTSIYDTWTRSGGAANGKCVAFAIINSNDVIGDNSWYWRADHGAGAGWTSNTTKNGVIINGKNVTYYGLFVEHCQEYQTLWNGDNGRLYMYQSEIPYDVPSAEVWSPKGGVGYASIKVNPSVQKFEGYGIGIYSLFNKANVMMDNAVETPAGTGVKLQHVIAVKLGAQGGFAHILNGNGGPVSKGNGKTKD
jgi:hypothetical protein